MFVREVDGKMAVCFAKPDKAALTRATNIGLQLATLGFPEGKQLIDAAKAARAVLRSPLPDAEAD